MFGYIKVNKGELSLEDQKMYRSFYCGTCRQLKKLSGIKGQLLRNFDMTFLAILLSGLYELEDVVVEEFNCPVHLFEKCTSRMNEATEYAAKMNILLSYYDVQEHWDDYGLLPKKTIANLFRKQYQEIEKEYPKQTLAVKRYLMKLSVAERGNEKNLDVVAGLTGDLMSELYAWKDDQWKDELKTLGFYIGKFMYMMKVYENVDKDIARNLYNPLILEKFNQSDKDFNTLVRLMLMSMMNEFEKSFQRLPIVLHKTILNNILSSGVLTKYDDLQMKRNKKKI